MASQTPSAVDAPTRLSRYRSQRRAQNPTTTTEPLPTVPPIPSPRNLSAVKDAVERTKSTSRYHRSPAKPAQATSLPKTRQAKVPPSPAHSNRSDPVSIVNSIEAPRYHRTKPRAPLPAPPPPAIAPPAAYSKQSRDTPVKPDKTPLPRSIPSQPQIPDSPHGQDETRQILDRESQRHHRMRKQQDSAKHSRRIESESRQAAEEKKKQKSEDEEKARKQREAEEEEIRLAAKEEKRVWAEKKKAEQAKRKEREKLDKIVAKATAVDEPTPNLFSFFRRKKTSDMPPSNASQEPQRPKTSSGEKATIKPGGGGIVPLNDAPVSAVNHGDRRVRIITQGKSILLPIKPTTTPLQLIRSSVTFFDVSIDPRNSLLMENFTKVGLQRTLRMYETVRNVLNSWDSDDQHTLTLQPYDSSQNSKLYATWAPKSKPEGGSWTMYFSQKKGKWAKRIVTMSPDGQISVAKNEQGKDHMNVCHLSDFELYSLSREGEKKRIRPPKKYCYAIKSNQKSSMFLGDTGFIHLFCSNDQAVADHFHDTIYRWRCWYLVQVMGEDGERKKVMENHVAASSAPLLSTSNTGDNKRSSVASQYILGSFNTGMDFDPNTFEVREEKSKAKHTRMGSNEPLAAAIAVSAANGLPSATEHSKALHARQKSIRRAANIAPPPPVAYAKYHTRDHSTNSGPQQLTPPSDGIDLALTNSTPSASSTSAGLQRTSSVRSTRRSLDRTNSLRHQPATTTTTAVLFPKPLIDLTPQHVEPVQHQRKGRAFKPPQVGQGPLIENATGPEHLPGAIVIPEAREWRSRAKSVSQNAVAAQRAVGATGGPVPAAAAAAANIGLARNSSVRSARRLSAGQSGGQTGRGLIGDLGLNAGFTGGLLASSQNQAGVGAMK